MINKIKNIINKIGKFTIISTLCWSSLAIGLSLHLKYWKNRALKAETNYFQVRYEKDSVYLLNNQR